MNTIQRNSLNRSRFNFLTLDGAKWCIRLWTNIYYDSRDKIIFNGTCWMLKSSYPLKKNKNLK